MAASKPKRGRSAPARRGIAPTVLLVTSSTASPALERALAAQGWPVVLAMDGRAAEQAIGQVPPDLAVVSERQSPRSTVALLRRLRRAVPGLYTVVLLREAAPEALIAYTNEGAHAMLSPPQTPARIVRAVRQLWNRQRDDRIALLSGNGVGHAKEGVGARLRLLNNERSRELSAANVQLQSSLREAIRKNKALAKLAESLRIQSTTDALTGLYNRREFLNRIRTEWGRYKRYMRPLSLIMLDIDHFKRINDTYGHECGDMVLRGLGHLISRNKRAQDLCCRYGGEEFMVVLTETTMDSAFHVAEGLRRLISDHPFEYEGQLIEVHISLGVSGALEQSPADVETFINLADKAMYRAKREGRNRTVVLDPADEAHIARQTPSEPDHGHGAHGPQVTPLAPPDLGSPPSDEP